MVFAILTWAWMISGALAFGLAVEWFWGSIRRKRLLRVWNAAHPENPINGAMRITSCASIWSGGLASIQTFASFLIGLAALVGWPDPGIRRPMAIVLLIVVQATIVSLRWVEATKRRELEHYYQIQEAYLRTPQNPDSALP